MFVRLSTKPALEEIDGRFFIPSQCKNKTRVIECYGDEGCGKTEVLLHFVVNTILPDRWEHLNIGGQNAVAIFIDLDYKFPMIRLISLLEQRLIACSESTEKCESSSNQFVKSCLERFYKVNCHSTLQFVITLYSLNKFINNRPDTSLILIDNILSFHWIDKYEHANKKGSQDIYQMEVVEALRKLISNFGLNVILSRPVLFADDSKVFAFHRYWSGTKNHRFHLQKTFSDVNNTEIFFFHSNNISASQSRVLYK